LKDTVYYKQAELLLRILPIINTETNFALKGGTAINFFIRDMPRLSVDIDLTYLRVNEREEALADISTSLLAVSGRIKRSLPDSNITAQKIGLSNVVRKLIVRHGDAVIKIEPNLVLRGFLFPTEVRTLSKRAQDMFETSVRMKLLSEAELYGGKICAALDRQHPRDLFDVKFFLDNDGFNEKTKKAFIVYLISHPRPIIELLNPNLLDVRDVYEKEFKDMAMEKVGYESLIKTRNQMISKIQKSLTVDDKQFVLSVKSSEPAWNLIELEGIKDLPAVKWKLLNIRKMPRKKHKEAFEKLRSFLEYL
jgi:predicted nucleotidyltransferase component of viral defense system